MTHHTSKKAKDKATLAEFEALKDQLKGNLVAATA
jgi:hypothetical protein